MISWQRCLTFPDDKLALSFGGSRSCPKSRQHQMRRFADTARMPASPLWQIAVETAEKTVAEWKDLEQADLLPKGHASFNREADSFSRCHSQVTGRLATANDIRFDV